MSLIWLHGSERLAGLFTSLLYTGFIVALAFAGAYLGIKLINLKRKLLDRNKK